MAVNKVIYGAMVLIDLTGDTVTPETLAEGVIAHDATGAKIVGTAKLKPAYTNLVPTSIDTDGSIYNGVGYKEKTRIRSGGAEGSNDYGSCTGFIRVNGGDVVRLSGWTFAGTATGNSINVADSSFANIGQVTTQPAYYGVLTAANSPITEENGVYTYIVPSGLNIAYIRVSGYDNSGDFTTAGPGASMIITVNEEIT